VQADRGPVGFLPAAGETPGAGTAGALRCGAPGDHLHAEVREYPRDRGSGCNRPTHCDPLRGPDHCYYIQQHHRKQANSSERSSPHFRSLSIGVLPSIPAPKWERSTVIPLPLLCQRREPLSDGYFAQTRDVGLLIVDTNVTVPPCLGIPSSPWAPGTASPQRAGNTSRPTSPGNGGSRPRTQTPGPLATGSPPRTPTPSATPSPTPRNTAR